MSSDDDIIAAAREGFLAEAQDMLRQFEDGLLTMEQDPADAEAMNSAFRAAHTIKGTAGLFGYDAVVSFTHEVESVLELMRAGKLPVSDEAMALLLQGRDRMEQLLAEVGQGTPSAELVEQSRPLAQALQRIRGAEGGATPSAKAAAAAPDTVAEAPLATWHLSLRMGADALRNGLDPLSFIRYLDKLGGVTGIRTLEDGVPALDAMDPEGCCLGFEIRLASAAARAEIEAVFEFLAEDCDLVVLAPEATPEDYETLLKRRAGDDAAREALLAHWQALAGPGQPPFIERRHEPQADRRQAEPERRAGAKDRRGGDNTSFLRVRADKLDGLIDMIGELVIASSGAQLVAQRESSPAFMEAALRIEALVEDARDRALGLRMVPIGETFARFQRVVRDVSKQLGKDVELELTGGDTELDKAMVETVADPLMHLVRNSLDHGLELPDDREANGKPRQGKLALNAYHEAGQIVVEVSDDGRGLNRERILAKAIERGLVAPDAQPSDAEVHELIMQPGFSTAEKITDISGRGVGMDVVRRNIESLRGQMHIASHQGKGTTIQIRLPLTLAIIDGFLTTVGDTHYVAPLESVVECIETPQACSAGERGNGYFDLRGEVLPYVDLRRHFRCAGDPPPRQSMVIVRTDRTKVGLLVDRLLGQHQTVIKPLSRVFQQLRGIAGSTILGSGEVALVLDVSALVAGVHKGATAR
ncbi:chemotaxis protein histidine kinase-like protein [Burkholderiales bacterium JOSHI_001]|nr:chemotaxis protein histidine kinase-like protein [Burkholderiales bacterium JOSHI_001]